MPKTTASSNALENHCPIMLDPMGLLVCEFIVVGDLPQFSKSLPVLSIPRFGAPGVSGCHVLVECRCWGRCLKRWE
jgi:hypothetical protein